MAKSVVYVCDACGYRASSFYGKCPHCGKWNSLREEEVQPEETPARAKKPSPLAGLSRASSPERITSLELPSYMRSSSGSGELDRVLGGGFVHGSVVLLTGEPGIGKSTILLQISSALGEEGKKVLYVSGEESKWQLRYRAKRLGVASDNVFVLTETDVGRILRAAEQISPDFLIVDSIQTMASDSSASSPGSVSQVRECAMRFIAHAKSEGATILLVGHVNKEGGIAGPKVLEHMVDAVISFEGERFSDFRILRATKNRYGSTDEIGVFRMSEEGLIEVENPSAALLEGRPSGVSGACAACLLEGTRPLLAEMQALVTPTSFPSPRRTCGGVDANRAALVLAVLEKRLGLRFSAMDVYVNVVGGLRLDEPPGDLPLALALISGIKDVPLPDDLAACGEVGLAGEVRASPHIEPRLREAARLGFTRIVLPAANERKLRPADRPEGAELLPVRTLYDALRVLT